jgi:hypothetical protein
VAAAYPVDAYQETGVGRLEAYNLAVKAGAESLPRGIASDTVR